MKNIKPLPGYAVIRKLEAEKKTASGLELPDSAQKQAPTGEVLSVGEKALHDSGRDYIVAHFKKGDVVVFNPYQDLEFRIEGVEYHLLPFDKVLAIVE